MSDGNKKAIEQPTIPSVTVDEMASARRKKHGKPTYPPDQAENIRLAVHRFVERFRSQLAAADALGVSQNSISTWLSGRSTPHVVHIDEMGKHLDMTELEIRLGKTSREVKEAQSESSALEVAVAYWPDRWPPQVVKEARRILAEGERLSPQGWTIRMDEIKQALQKVQPRR